MTGLARSDVSSGSGSECWILRLHFTRFFNKEGRASCVEEFFNFYQYIIHRSSLWRKSNPEPNLGSFLGPPSSNYNYNHLARQPCTQWTRQGFQYLYDPLLTRYIFITLGVTRLPCPAFYKNLYAIVRNRIQWLIRAEQVAQYEAQTFHRSICSQRLQCGQHWYGIEHELDKVHWVDGNIW